MGSETERTQMNIDSSQWAAEFERENQQIASRNAQANWNEQFDRQIQEWTRQFMLENEEYAKRQDAQMEREYAQWLRTQSPEALLKHAAKAGIAPAAMLSHMMSGGASAGSAAAPSGKSVPSPSGAGTGVAGATPAHVESPTEITQLSQAVQAIAAAGGSYAQQISTIGQLNANIKSKLSEAQYRDSLTSYQNLYNNIYAASGDKKFTSEIMLNITKAYMAAEQGNSEDSKRFLNYALGDMYKSQNKEIQAQLPFVGQKAKEQVNLLLEQQKTEKAQQRELGTRSLTNVEQARMYGSQSDLLEQDKELRVAQTEYQYIINNISRPESDFSLLHRNEIVSNYVTRLQKDNLLAGQDLEEANKRLRELENIRNLPDWVQYNGQFMDWIAEKIPFVAVSNSVGNGAPKTPPVTKSRNISYTVPYY